MNAPAAQEVMMLNIYQRLNEVRKAIAFIQKDKPVSTGGQGSYMAVTHDAVTAAVRPHLIQHGIMVVPRLTKAATIQDSGMTTGKGIPIIRYEATFDIDFVNCDEPADKATVTIEAHALDNGDKAPGKAASYATKYAMLKLFSIETGEDDEGRLEVKAAKEDKTKGTGVIKPASGVEERIAPERKEPLLRLSASIQECVEADMALEALKIGESIADPDEKVFAFDQLPSKTRSLLKRTRQEMMLTKKEAA